MELRDFYFWLRRQGVSKFTLATLIVIFTLMIASLIIVGLGLFFSHFPDLAGPMIILLAIIGCSLIIASLFANDLPDDPRKKKEEENELGNSRND